MCSVLRRHEVDVEVLDLENAVGNPAPLDREAFLNNAEDALRRVKADLVAISCSSTLQYKASTAVAAIVRRLLPEAAIAVTGFTARAAASCVRRPAGTPAPDTAVSLIAGLHRPAPRSMFRSGLRPEAGGARCRALPWR